MLIVDYENRQTGEYCASSEGNSGIILHYISRVATVLPVSVLVILLGACDQRSIHDRGVKKTHLCIVRPSREVTGGNKRLIRVTVSQFQMGMMVHLTVWAKSIQQGQEACQAAFQHLRRINMIMSDYEPESELLRLCRHSGQGPIHVSKELFEVLDTARWFAELTDGLYDPTVGPITHAWRKARDNHQIPQEFDLQNARTLVGYEKLVLNPENQTVELKRSGMLLDLGALAKGYAGDQMLRVLQQHDVTCAAYEAGGDIVLGDAPPDAKGWTIAPELRNVKPSQLSNCAVSVSGDTVQYLEAEGKHYSHVIDPRTGQGVTSRHMCYVVAPTGLYSDPLATLGTIMSPKQYEVLLTKYFPQVQALVFTNSPDRQGPLLKIPSP